MERVKNLKNQPCCGFFLQGGVRAIAMLDIGISLFSMILIASEIIRKFAGLLELKRNNATLHLYYIRGIVWASYFAIKIIIIGLSVFLFKFARLRNRQMCKVWMILTIIVNVWLVASALATYILFSISTLISMFLISYIIYKIYSIHVVYTFILEIKSYGGFNVCLSGLTDAEVEEFEKGHPPEFHEMKDELLMVKKQAFNKDFEIPFDKLEIDENAPLGSGAFGTVYRAKLIAEIPGRSVAVKTVNSNADPIYFKTLLGELKIMTFLSPNENIVNLIGACTSQIQHKQLYIVVEFCPYGNLHDYLKARRGLFINYVKDGELTAFKGGLYQNISDSNSLTTANLIQWSYEMAKGMEFLEEKKVIHGDLASRNVLLGYGKIAKITDFGLSKKLYQYTNYVQKEEKLLPWRWMAIESLSDMKFSSKSDIWSYGITIWEIFSLSEVPYPGFNWNMDFIAKIIEGLRMTQPANTTNEIYDLMLNCWHIKAEARPTFTQIREFFLQKYVKIEDADENKEQPNNIMTDNSSDNPGIETKPKLEEVEVYIGNQMLITSSEDYESSNKMQTVL